MFRSVVNRIDSQLAETQPPGEVVLTVHGLLAGCRSMRCLAAAARREGYAVMDWGYPSLRGSILHHASGLSRMLCDLAKRDSVKQIHLVTHSMGGVIARAAILQSRVETRWADKCGRIVMLAPPNAGSRLTRLPLGPFASWFPQLRELSEAPDSFVRQLPGLRRMRVGVIAAQRDFVVDERSTHLVGQRDHATVATSHQRLTRHPDAIEMTIEFLKTACLKPSGSTIAIAAGHVEHAPGRQRRRVHSAAA